MNEFVYLIVLGADIKREEFTDFLDASPNLVTDWFYSMPSSIFVVSQNCANALYDSIHTKFGDKRIFITRIGAERQGYMPTSHWDRINRVQG